MDARQYATGMVHCWIVAWRRSHYHIQDIYTADDLRHQLARNAEQMYGGSPLTPFVMPAAQALIRTFRRMSLDDAHPELPHESTAMGARAEDVHNVDPAHDAPAVCTASGLVRDVPSEVSVHAASAPTRDVASSTRRSTLDGTPTREAPFTPVRVVVNARDASPHVPDIPAGITSPAGAAVYAALTRAHDVPAVGDSLAAGSPTNPTINALANVLIEITRKRERRARAKAMRRRRRAAARANISESAADTAAEESEGGSIPSLETVLDSEDPSSDDVNDASSGEDFFDSD